MVEQEVNQQNGTNNLKHRIMKKLNVTIESMPELKYRNLAFLFELLCEIADRKRSLGDAFNLLASHKIELAAFNIMTGLSASHIWISTVEGQRFVIITEQN